jgi:hypothetical protein
MDRVRPKRRALRFEMVSRPGVGCKHVGGHASGNPDVLRGVEPTADESSPAALRGNALVEALERAGFERTVTTDPGEAVKEPPRIPDFGPAVEGEEPVSEPAPIALRPRELARAHALRARR